MSYNEPIESIYDDVLIVGVTDLADSYFLWQRGLTEDTGSEDGIHFEFDDQINGGYDIVKVCIVTTDGIHVELTDGKRVQFYFPNGFDKFEKLEAGLSKIYSDNLSILKFNVSAAETASDKADPRKPD